MNDLKQMVRSYQQQRMNGVSGVGQDWNAIEIANYVSSLVDDDVERLQDMHAIVSAIRREVRSALRDPSTHRDLAIAIADELKRGGIPQ